ncbi:MAG: histidinol-phosphate aminotransferase [Cellvibrionaceae bacterium]|jgi:histidinol-phosphate aminotransferase
MSIIKKHILAMSAYKPPLDGRNPKVHMLLDFNERTIPVSDALVKALNDYIADGRLQQYPAYGDIVQRLSRYAGVKPEQLMITNGSDQGIDLVFRAVVKSDAEAIIPAPSFAMYTQCAKVEAMKLIEPVYTKANGYPLQGVLDSITPNTAIIVVSNPNNPCGTIVSEEVITQIANAAPHAAILVDECYYEYSRKTIVASLADLPNLFITRTFSKTWGIPSLRFGYLMAAPEYIRALCNIRGPYDINQLAIVAAEAALDNPDYTERYVKEVMQAAKPLLEKWLAQNNIDFWPSSANYIWVFPKNAELVNQYLSENGVLVRPKPYAGEMGLRITVGTLEQTQKLIDLLNESAK